MPEADEPAAFRSGERAARPAVGRETPHELKAIRMDIIRIIAAVLLPPLGVFLQVGLGKHFWINIILTLLGYIPGIIHAVWVIAKY